MKCMKLSFPKWLKRKFLDPKDLEKKVQELRKNHKKIVTLNGSFDLLHAGHLHILYEAKEKGDILIVALNTDESVKKYKSENRPIITLYNRLQMISSLECVDFVTYFDETDPRAVLKKIRPDIHANGAEYGSDCIEKETVESFKGKIYTVNRINGLSTSEIIKSIQCVK